MVKNFVSQVKEAVKEIKLNCLDIEISSASYRSQGFVAKSDLSLN